MLIIASIAFTFKFLMFSKYSMQNYSGEEELCCVYVPTNHLYIGDIFLVNTKDVIRPNLSVREGIGKDSVILTFILSNISFEHPCGGGGGGRGNRANLLRFFF
jgi:hypothetical protein